MLFAWGKSVFTPCNIAFICVGRMTVYRLLKNGDISSLKIGRAYRIPKAHLLAYLKIRKVSGLW